MIGPGLDVNLHGILPMLPTPFRGDGSIDETSLRHMIDVLVGEEVNGIATFGLASEVPRLTAAEREHLTHVILSHVAGRIPVLIGVGAESTHTTLALSRIAAHAGAMGLIVAPPTAVHTDKKQLLRHFSRVADAVDLPLMIQDAPAYLGVELGPDLVAELARAHPNVAFVKLEVSGEGVAAWRAQTEDAVQIFGGNAGLYLLECLRNGAVGLIPGADLARCWMRIYNLECAGRTDEADRLFERVLPLVVFQMQTLDHLNACIKRILHWRGIVDHPNLREPCSDLSEKGIIMLRRHAECLDLIERVEHA